MSDKVRELQNESSAYLWFSWVVILPLKALLELAKAWDRIDEELWHRGQKRRKGL